MTHAMIYKTYPIVVKMKQYSLPGKTAYKLHKLAKELKEVYDFQIDEHQKLFRKYEPEYDEKTGQLSFKTPEDCQAFLQAMDELDKLEHEMENPALSLALKDEYLLSAEEIETLEGLIDFYEETEPVLIPLKEAPEPEEAAEASK